VMGYLVRNALNWIISAPVFLMFMGGNGGGIFLGCCIKGLIGRVTWDLDVT
jgi:hypothetical protein